MQRLIALSFQPKLTMLALSLVEQLQLNKYFIKKQQGRTQAHPEQWTQAITILRVPLTKPKSNHCNHHRSIQSFKLIRSALISSIMKTRKTKRHNSTGKTFLEPPNLPIISSRGLKQLILQEPLSDKNSPKNTRRLFNHKLANSSQ